MTDGLNDLTTLTDSLDNTTSASYDGDHQVTGVQTPEGETAAFTYDSFGNILKTKTGTTPLSNPMLAIRAMAISSKP